MSSYRNVLWRGAFALALLPVSVGLVAANGAAPEGAESTWCYELAMADVHERMVEREQDAARRLADARAQERSAQPQG